MQSFLIISLYLGKGSSIAELKKNKLQESKTENSLEESLNLFREGTQLVADCSKLLEQARLQVELVTQGADGMPKTEAFEYDE